ncbi:hypothetical protein DFH28DRAFT_1123489 [Melampsora americana]|nr:hypothetical protein DFH28DRAFT_1123489 [Melampsora americana]
MLDPGQKGVTREDMYMWLYDFDDRKVKYSTGLTHRELAKLVRSKQPDYFPNPDSDSPALVLGDCDTPSRRRKRHQLTEQKAPPSAKTPQLSAISNPIYPTLTHLSSTSQIVPIESHQLKDTVPSESVRKTKKKPKLVGKDEDCKPIVSRRDSTGPITPKDGEGDMMDLSGSDTITTPSSQAVVAMLPTCASVCKTLMGVKNHVLQSTQTFSDISNEDVREELKGLQDSLVPNIDFPSPVPSHRLIATEDLHSETDNEEKNITPSSKDLLTNNPYMADLMSFTDFDIFDTKNDEGKIAPLDPELLPTQLMTTVSTLQDKHSSFETHIPLGAHVSHSDKSEEGLRDKEISHLRQTIDELNGHFVRLNDRLAQIEEDMVEALTVLSSLVGAQDNESDLHSDMLSEEE